MTERRSEERDAKRRPRPRRRRWPYAAALALVVLGVWALSRQRIPAERLPSPNGYDDVVAAAASIQGVSPQVGEPSKAADDVLRGWLEPNAKALARARVGLARESRVPMAVSINDPVIVRRPGALRELARLFLFEASLAEHAGRSADAAAGYADIVRLANVAAFGGLTFDKSTAQALERQTLDGLDRVASSLSAVACRERIADLLRAEREREPFARVMDRDQAFGRATSPWQIKLMLVIRPGMFTSLTKPALAAGEAAERLNLARLRLTTTALAVRAYRLDHPGASPPLSSLDVLVPAYLPALPIDPYAKGPLRLKVEGDAVRVYSVGPNGQDDGGTPMPKNTRPGPGVPGDLVSGPV